MSRKTPSSNSTNAKKTPWINRFKLGSNKPSLVDSSQPRINLQENVRQSGFCPYKAWKNYFPTEDFSPMGNVAAMVKVFEKYMQKYFSSNNIETAINNCYATIDYKDLSTNEIVTQAFPNFHALLHDQPETVIACIGLATHQTILKDQQAKVRTGSLNKAAADIPVIRARIHGFEPLTTLKHLKAKNYGKFISIRGTIVKVSNVRPLCTTMAFCCSECGTLQALLLLDHNYVVPNACSGGCNGKTFQPLHDHPLTEIRDWQTVKLQETLSDTHREAGRMPRNVEVELTHDLSDTASPGDVVTVTGIVKIKKAEENGYFSKKGRDKCLHLLYIEGNSVNNSRRLKMQDCRDGNVDMELEFSERDLLGIEEIKKQPDIFPLLVSSLCPTIFGQEMVKAGILLSLFGGSQRGGEGENDRVATRGDSHVLVVGDPGLGKSQILRAASRLAPRAVYVCGNTSTGSGLTVTLSRDSSGDMALEAGALVLADQGVCCIDEFDKMTGQQHALLEAMEQQCISIAKAGIVCSLPARCSIIAAANPIGGHYNKAKTVSENLHMGSALLSRFDLVFILLDTPDEEKDRMLSDYVMSMHTGKQASMERKFSEESPTKSEETFSKMSSLEAHLARYARSQNCDPIPHALAWKYIAYARRHCREVSLSTEACQVLKTFYLKLRKQGYYGDSTPITTRQLESLKRLSEARAKCEMRSIVTASDAQDVVDIMKHSMQDTFSNEDNLLVFTRSMHGSGVSKKSAVKKLLNALHKAAISRSNSMFSFNDLQTLGNGVGITDKLYNIIESLNTQGFLLKKGGNMYQLQTMN